MMLAMGLSKLLPMICCIAIFHVVFLHAQILGADYLASANCCTECSCNVTESGECYFQYREDCSDGTCIYLDFPRESSIIEVEASTEYHQNTTNSTTKVSPTADTKGAIKLDIYEFNTETNEYVLLETRYLYIDGFNSSNEKYLTRTSNAIICASHVTDWSPYKMKLSFQEWEYRRLKPEVENAISETGEILGNYVPNSVSLYKLPEDPTIKWKGIEITIQGLEIDKENGEYLLIGAGSPDDCPPRFLSSITQYSLFYVANASAYVEFVSRSISKKDESFKILWNRIDPEMPTPIKPVDTLNAILVCFYNYSEAKKEFEEKDDMDEVFLTFREAFAESVRNNTKQKYYCMKSSVKLIGHPTEFKSSNALSILITLDCEGKLFKYQELQNLIAHFEAQDLNKTLGYKVGLCPTMNNPDLFYKEKWSILIYALVPTCGLLILMIWAWKNNIFRQKCSPEKEGSSFGFETNSPPVEQNTYEAPVPKVCLDDGYGRRQTLIPGSPREDVEGEEDNVTEVEMSAIPSTSRASDTLIRVLTNRKSKRRPSIQSLISIKEENCNEKSEVPKSEGDESEHLYDSVSSSREMTETKL